MASTTLSDAEFERLQNQLLELKNSNYTLEEKCRKQIVETLQYKEKCESLEKDLSKYQNLAKLNPLAFAKTFQLNKGQKEKELIDSLNEEKDLFQKKLKIQEDEFKLTNDMLRQEILNLMDEIKNLKSTNNKVPNDSQSDHSSPLSTRCGLSNDSNDEITLQLTPNSQRKAKISYALLSEKEQLETNLSETTKNLDLIQTENQNLKTKFNELTDNNFKLELNLKQLKELNSSYFNEISHLKGEVEKEKKEAINFKELAEKRKSTIDELKCHIEDTSDKAESAIENANKKVNEIKSSLNKELSLLKAEKKDLIIKIEELQKQLEQNSEYEAQCAKLAKENEELNKKLDDYELTKQLIEKLEDEKQKIAIQLHDENELKLKELNEFNESLKEQLSQKESLIKKLRQDVEDQIEEHKIQEKKAVMYVRELKKQLNNEKRMKERLQEKSGEILSEKSFDIGSKSFDTQSVGSWSFLSSSNNVKDQKDKNNSSYSIHSSTDGNLNTPNGLNSPISEINSTMTNGSYSHNQILEKENTQLVLRLTKLQQEKWALEEKVNNILLTIEKLESELEIKQKIISFYCMERRAEPIKSQNSNSNDKFTVKKVVDFIKDKSGDENLKEINKKLQKIVEETLTKNMHLQNNLELLSNELQSLKK